MIVLDAFTTSGMEMPVVGAVALGNQTQYCLSPISCTTRDILAFIKFLYSAIFGYYYFGRK